MVIFPLVAAVAALAAGVPHTAEQPRIRILIVTGGHDFERDAFLDVFRSDPGVMFRHVEHPNAQAEFGAEAARAYDVIVLCDLTQQISSQARADLLKLVRAGKGVLALHHSLGNYQEWPEYEKLIGGRYWLAPHMVGTQAKPGSTYEHGVQMRVHVVNPVHPVTRGIGDFDIIDETYGGFDVQPDVKPLLTTDAPTSGHTIGWEHTYGRGRVVYLELGHDHTAYENPSYRRLVAQAIRWVARRPAPRAVPESQP